MARNFGKIFARIWNDRDFRALPAGPQRLYLFLVTQDNVDHSGMLPITLKRWAAAAEGMTVAQVEDDLDVLDRARFVVTDGETEELLIRTFIRNDEVYKQPKVMLAAVTAAQKIISVRLRLALLAEVGRLPLEDLPDAPTKTGAPHARAVVTQCVETLRRTLSAPGDPDPERPETLPERVPETLPETLWDDFEPESEDEPVDNREYADQDADGKGSGKGIGNPHVHAPARTTTTRASSKPFPPSADADPPSTGHALELVHSAPLETSAPATVDELVADWLDHIPKRPPGSIIGRVGKHIKQLLADGIEPADVRAGVVAWTRKGLDPSTLPSVVNQTMNARPNLRDVNDLGGDAHMERFLARQAARNTG